MAVLPANVDGSLEHQGRERDPLYPCPEAKGEEDAEDEEHDARAPVLPPQIKDGSAQGPADVKDASHPNELLRENAREPDVAKAEDHCDDEDEDEENYCAGVERKGIRAIVDTAALDVSGRRVSMECYARDNDEADTEEEELPAPVVSDPGSCCWCRG